MRARRANASRSTPRNADAEATQMRYASQDNDGALFWADRGVGLCWSAAAADRERLTQVARRSTTRPRRTAAEHASRVCTRTTSLEDDSRRAMSQFGHRKSGIKSSARLKIAPGDHAKLSSVRSADRRKRPRPGFGTALVPRSRPHLFPDVMRVAEAVSNSILENTSDLRANGAS